MLREVCADCTLCSPIYRHPYVSIGFGNLKADVLVIFTDGPYFASSVEHNELIAPTLEHLSKADQATAYEAIRMSDDVARLEELVDVFGSLESTCYATARRCSLVKDEEQAYINCGLYTRSMMANKKLFVVTMKALAQISEKLIEKAEPYKWYKTTQGIVYVIEPFEEMDSDRRGEVRTTINRLRKGDA